MRKFLYMPVLAAVAALTVLAAGPAQAAGGDVLTAGGNNVVVNDVITGSSTSAVLSTSIGKITCTVAGFSAKAASNPAAPGTATETVTSLSASSCTSTITGTTGVTSVGLNGSSTPTASVCSTSACPASPVTTVPELFISPTVKVVLTSVLGPVTCIYGGTTLFASVNNAGDSFTFTSQSVNRQTGSSTACPSTGTYTATYGSVKDTTMTGSPAITVN
jgi:hypothetical protein